MKELPPLYPGQKVSVYDKTAHAWCPGQVMHNVAPRSYLVENARGNVIRRNRAHLNDRPEGRPLQPQLQPTTPTRPSHPPSPNRSPRPPRPPSPKPPSMPVDEPVVAGHSKATRRSGRVVLMPGQESHSETMTRSGVL